MVCSILEHMCSATARGENVKISGFGSFLLREKSERVGRNPKTGEEHAIEPRRVMTFRASATLKQRIVRVDQEEAAAAVTSHGAEQVRAEIKEPAIDLQSGILVPVISDEGGIDVRNRFDQQSSVRMPQSAITSEV